jgi:tRNA-2-methylthio-N6-dimethylallyladenosine synthase
MEKQKVYVKSYGCQMNVYDSSKMSDLLKPHGYTTTGNPEDADLVILNTCHIREKAEQKVFSDLGRIRNLQDEKRKAGKDLIIAVGGCVAQAEGEEILRQAPYVSMVFGTQTYHRLPEMLEKIRRKNDKEKKRLRVVDTDFPLEEKFDFLPLPEQTTVSAFLSIQEGCDKFCSFCCVPYTRGSEFSRDVKKILEEAQHLVDLGAKEITLLGQNVNAFHGIDLDGKESNLGKLLFAIAEKIPDIKRIRYTTSHPKDMHDDLIKAHQEIPAVMPFVHLPVQSGSNRILKLMNRKHTRADYLKIIENLKKAKSDMAFSSDFIVGFPDETNSDFQETISLINEVGYAQAYSFKYSIRHGTPAGAMENQIPEEIKTERLHELQEVVTKNQLEFNLSKVGTVQKILVDRVGKNREQLIGKTPYMQSVPIEGEKSLLFGNFLDVKITEGFNNSLSGVLVT